MNQTIDTQRLKLGVCSYAHLEDEDFLLSALSIMTEEVTQALPPSFQGLTNQIQVRDWLDGLLTESVVYWVRAKNDLIGFIFVSIQCQGVEKLDHIGYLLGESFWRQGYASEMLTGLIAHVHKQGDIYRLVAGVATDNLGSIGLLEKLGFQQQARSEFELGMRQYQLPLQSSNE